MKIIVLIDDDAICNFITENMLLDTGFSHEIVTFQSAVDALEFLEQELPSCVPEIIFLDLNMPQMDGWQFLEALAPLEKYLAGKCHIFILTSSITQDDQQKATEYDLVSGVIHKPITEEDLQFIHATLEARSRH